ncbi:MAG: restriction endonuclease subunit S [Polyangiaceae bacterium]
MTETTLPQGWARVPIGAVCRLINGRAFKPSDWTTEGLPIVRIQNLNNSSAPFNRFDQPVEDKYYIETGELLFAWSGTPGTSFGAHIWSGPRAVLNQHIFRVLFDDRLFEKRFLRMSINERLDHLIGVAHGGAGLAHVTKPVFEAAEILVAPRPEQERIVAKQQRLEERSRRAREALDEVPALIEKLRQSILAAAFRGDLTKDWRAKNPDVEPAEKLLQRIREEHRHQWAATQQEKNKNASSEQGRRAKYEEPSLPDSHSLPKLPNGWTWSTLPLLGELARGKSKHRPRNDERLFGETKPFIQTGDVARSRGRIKSYSAMYSEFGVAQSRVFPKGTVCITIAGNIAETGLLEFDACFPDSVVGFISDSGLTSAKYVEFFLRIARTDLKRFAPATAQANINLEILGDVVVPVPPLAEREVIVQRLEAALSRAETMETIAREQLSSLSDAERSILSKAFRGELVPQDPSDEPASLLLARLRSSAAAADTPQGTPPKKNTKPRSARKPRASGDERG